MKQLKDFKAISDIWDDEGTEFEIFYSKPSFFRDALAGLRGLQSIHEDFGKDAGKDMNEFYVSLGTIKISGDPEETLFMLMQGENWSPNGEAREFIKEKGLKHTSMSVGDVIKNAKSGRYYMVDMFGFSRIQEKSKTAEKDFEI
ncbi:hypothetical protein AB4254_11670 [Vibrio breoganii]